MKTVAEAGLDHWRDYIAKFVEAKETARERLRKGREQIDAIRAEQGSPPLKYKAPRKPCFEELEPEKSAQILHLIQQGATQWKAHKETGVNALAVGRLVFRHKDALMAAE